MLRRLNTADLTLITIGAVIGSGIFRNPSVVAHHVHTPFLILGVWVAGGALAFEGKSIARHYLDILEKAGSVR